MFQSIVEAVLYYSEKQPDKLCLADDRQSVTYREYSILIRKYAAVLQNLGIRKGETVVVEACQSVSYLAIQQALTLVKAIFVPVEHNCAGEKIKSFIDRAHASAAIVSKNEDEYSPGAFSYDELEALVKEQRALEVTRVPDADAICEILFSTGTTGVEKGIVIRHRNNIALAENVMYGVEMQEDNVEMIPSPMNHSHGLRRYYANMVNGSSVVLLGSVMDMARFFGNMDRYGVNAMDLVPAALTVLLKLSRGKLAEYQEQIRYIQFGSAPLMEGDVEKVRALLPGTRMYNFYGSTESGCTCIYEFNRCDAKKNCIGKPAHNVRVSIVDDARRPIASSEEHAGYVATAGKMNTSGYWEDEAETLRAIADGVVYSNDIGYVDEDGDIILLGRKGDVINVGGNKVAPLEIENAAAKIPEIADCGCVAAYDKSKGQVPKLFVQLAPGAQFDAKRIRAALANLLEPYKVPVYIEQIEKIPRSFNGKLLRKELCSDAEGQ